MKQTNQCGRAELMKELNVQGMYDDKEHFIIVVSAKKWKKELKRLKIKDENRG